MGAVLRGVKNPFRHRARAVVVIALLALITGILALMMQATLASRQQIASMEGRVRTLIELREAGALGTGGFGVMLPMEFAGVAADERRRRAARLLEQVDLSTRSTHRPRELSGGEQQRVAIARALANNPRLVLADEPTGNLDSRTGRLIFELLNEISRERTVVVVTHAEALAALADDILHLTDGHLATNDRRRTSHV